MATEKTMENLKVLSDAMIQIEELIGKMGGFISPDLKVYQTPDGAFVSVKTTLGFKMAKLNEYFAQSDEQEGDKH
ncbi:MAG: hypothetical protein LBI67_05540 [Treponema sp.]|jgi:hypothetical protein|nr:hypothetical protein [Treponema sp.]